MNLRQTYVQKKTKLSYPEPGTAIEMNKTKNTRVWFIETQSRVITDVLRVFRRLINLMVRGIEYVPSHRSSCQFPCPALTAQDNSYLQPSILSPTSLYILRGFKVPPHVQRQL
jgi:hypothetical protein